MHGRRFTGSTRVILRKSVPREKICDCLEKEKGDKQSSEHDYENQTENHADEDPIALAGAGREIDMPLEQTVVSFVRFEPQSKTGAENRDHSDQFVDQNVQRHAREQDLG